MDKRLKLQSDLEHLLGSGNVYYQPPASLKIDYPAIVYSRYEIVNLFADDRVYAQFPHYQITVIDQDPDSEIVHKVSQLPHCRFDRHFKADNLNHDVFIIY